MKLSLCLSEWRQFVCRVRLPLPSGKPFIKVLGTFTWVPELFEKVGGHWRILTNEGKSDAALEVGCEAFVDVGNRLFGREQVDFVDSNLVLELGGVTFCV